MLTTLEAGLGLDVVIWLQAHSNGLLDGLGIMLHYLGSTVAYMVVLGLLYWAVDRRLGTRLIFAVILASVATNTLKELLQRPRPHLAYPDQVTALVTQEGYGLPSGHVLIALLAWGTLVVWINRRGMSRRTARWLWLAVAAYALLMGWARMVVGVHYPQDVVTSLVVGGLLLGVYARYADAVVDWWRRLSLAGQVAVVLASSGLVILLTQGYKDGLTMAGFLLGGGLALAWDQRRLGYRAPDGRTRRAWCFVGGVILLLGVYLGLTLLFDRLPVGPLVADGLRLLRYALVAGIGLAFWPWLSVRLELAARTR